MLRIPFPSMSVVLLAFGLAVASTGIAADQADPAITVGVENVSIKLGKPTTMIATITPRAGYRIADAYRNRLFKLSAADDGLVFDDKPVRGTMENGSLVFRFAVTATKTGAHAINGVMRIGLVSARDGIAHLDIKSEPLIATITGTE